MPSFSDRFIQIARNVLPTPMAIAILLTALTVLLALTLTTRPYEAIEIKDNTTETLLATLSLTAPKTHRFQVPSLPDSIFVEMEANAIVLQIKGEGVLYRQPVQVKPKEKPLNEKVKLPKGHSIQIIQKHSAEPYILRVLTYWEGGFFNFLTFAMQMMLILVLGHLLALSPPADWLIRRLVNRCNSTAKAAYIITLTTLLVAFFNWGLALVFGAIFARKVGEYASQKGFALNYPLIGAAGYSGLMVWHGGLSGSAPLKIAEQNHELVAEMGVIPIGQTIFSTMNLTCSLLLLVFVPMAMFLMAKLMRGQNRVLNLQIAEIRKDAEAEKPIGAERLDYARWFAWTVGGIMLFLGIYKTIIKPVFIEGVGFDWSFRFVNPNYLIFILFGLALVLHSSLRNFNKGVEEAIGGAAGIMIQFPLYAGIMGIMLESGLVDIFSNFFISISNETTYPLFTFISAGFVNMFVPSGGGQWLVQGPIVIESSLALGIPLEKSIMALCYGDQVTNMLQPFWALPLLGITKLKAQEILPYTFFLFLMGSLIFCAILLIF